jgi:hypothetical protein
VGSVEVSAATTASEGKPNKDGRFSFAGCSSDRTDPHLQSRVPRRGARPHLRLVAHHKIRNAEVLSIYVQEHRGRGGALTVCPQLSERFVR